VVFLAISVFRELIVSILSHTNASTNDVQKYTITLPTSAGSLTVPLLGGNLTLTGKDSKIHVVDYEAGSTTLLYSTGEIATWYVDAASSP
jgi:hypothetical protein